MERCILEVAVHTFCFKATLNIAQFIMIYKHQHMQEYSSTSATGVMAFWHHSSSSVIEKAHNTVWLLWVLNTDVPSIPRELRLISRPSIRPPRTQWATSPQGQPQSHTCPALKCNGYLFVVLSLWVISLAIISFWCICLLSCLLCYNLGCLFMWGAAKPLRPLFVRVLFMLPVTGLQWQLD